MEWLSIPISLAIIFAFIYYIFKDDLKEANLSKVKAGRSSAKFEKEAVHKRYYHKVGRPKKAAKKTKVKIVRD